MHAVNVYLLLKELVLSKFKLQCEAHAVRECHSDILQLLHYSFVMGLSHLSQDLSVLKDGEPERGNALLIRLRLLEGVFEY